MGPGTDNFPQIDCVLIVRSILFRAIDKLSEFIEKLEDDRLVEIGGFGKEIDINLVGLDNLVHLVTWQLLDLRLSWARICWINSV